MSKAFIPVVALASVVVFAVAFVVTRANLKEARASQVMEWSMGAKDLLAWEGIDAQLVGVDREVAAIVTDSRTRAAIFQAVMRLQWKADELQADVSRERGVAVVRSGTAWVARR